MQNKKYIWICDDPQCGFKSFSIDEAGKHSEETKHVLTKCKNLNFSKPKPVMVKQ